MTTVLAEPGYVVLLAPRGRQEHLASWTRWPRPTTAARFLAMFPVGG